MAISQLVETEISSGGDAGNSVSSATSLTNFIPLTLSGSAGFGGDDDDYYSLVAQTSGALTVILGGLSANLNLRLLSSSGQELESSFLFSSNTETIAYDVAAGTTYVVRVDPYLTEESAYTLDISLSGQGPNDVVSGNSIGDAGGSPSSATTVVVADSIVGSVGYGADEDDYYQLTPSTDGRLFAQASDLSQNINLWLYSSTGEQLDSSTLSGSSTQTVSAIVSAGESYLVRLDPEGIAESEYNVVFTFDEAPGDGGFDESWIGDAGNDRLSATTVYLPAAVTGSVGGATDTDDYYAVVPWASGAMTASLSGLSADLDLRLYSGSGTLLRSSEAGSTSDESIQYDVIGGVTYYVRIDPSGQAVSDYRLDLALTGTGSPDLVDRGSIGDAGGSRAEAAPLTTSSSVSGSVGFGADDLDYYKFTAGSDGSVSVVLDGMSADLDLRLVSSSGSLLASSTGSGTSSEAVSIEVAAGGEYYIRIDPVSGSESAYDLRLALSGTPGSLLEFLTFYPTQTETVQDAYIAYYGRPADPGGLVYWTTQLIASQVALDEIIQAFGNSEEFDQRFGGQDNTALVTNVYQNLFGRDPDPEGLDFYVGILGSGAASLQSVALDILNGARNQDLLLIDARETIADRVTLYLDETGVVIDADRLAQVTTDGAITYGTDGVITEQEMAVIIGNLEAGALSAEVPDGYWLA